LPAALHEVVDSPFVVSFHAVYSPALAEGIHAEAQHFVAEAGVPVQHEPEGLPEAVPAVAGEIGGLLPDEAVVGLNGLVELQAVEQGGYYPERFAEESFDCAANFHSVYSADLPEHRYFYRFGSPAAECCSLNYYSTWSEQEFLHSFDVDLPLVRYGA
jgi:hypothetical protein